MLAADLITASKFYVIWGGCATSRLISELSDSAEPKIIKKGRVTTKASRLLAQSLHRGGASSRLEQPVECLHFLGRLREFTPAADWNMQAVDFSHFQGRLREATLAANSSRQLIFCVFQEGYGQSGYGRLR